MLKTGDDPAGYTSDEEAIRNPVTATRSLPWSWVSGSRTGSSPEHVRRAHNKGAQLRRMEWWQGQPVALDKSS